MNKAVGRLMLAISVLVVGFGVTSARADCPTDIEAAVAAACPCGGPASGGVWKNHGQFQRCVVHFRNDLRRQKCLTRAAQTTIARCAARSTCGKPDAVLCCAVSSTGTCSDATPGDSVQAGTCSNDATITCDVAADCTVLRGPRVKRDAALCTSRGGYVSGTGSVCGGCTAPVACCLATGCQILTDADCTAQGGSSPAGSVPACNPSPCP